MRIVRLGAGELPGLAELLVDAVENGASVGFLRPFTAGEAARWWAGHAAAVAEGRTAVWAAAEDGEEGEKGQKKEERKRWIGTVSLVFEPKPNGRHRAEIAKLLVSGAARRRGVARALLAVAERAAADAGVTLLLLDTQKDSGAEHLYRSAGWIKFGEVPGHAADPDGVLRPTSYYRKSLPAAVAPWAGEAELGDLLASYHRATQREKGEAELTDRYRKEIRDPAGAFAGDTVLVAWHGGAAVGCVVLTAPVAGEAELKRLWVDPAARGRGVASALTRAALARAEGAAVRLTVWGWRTGARALYERLGFAQVTSWDGRDGLVCMRRPGGPGGPGGALSGPASVPPV